MAGSRVLWIAAVLALTTVASPAPAQDPAAGEALVDCPSLAAERAEAQAEHRTVKRVIADIALGRRPSKSKRLSGAAAARGAATAAAGVLLPFPFGLAVGAASTAGRKKAEPAPESGPDVTALIERQHRLEARLSEIAVTPCF